MGVIAVILLYPYTTVYLYIFTILLIFLAIYLSIKSEKASILSKNYHRLRDDSSEKSERLLSQNLSLEKAKEDEIYTAQLSERNRIAREIHDNVGHMLSRALLQTGAMLAIHKEEPVHGELADLRSTLDTAMNNIRSSVHDLHDESIDLNAGIEQMTELLRNSGRFNVNVEIDTDRNMPRDIKYAILGIAKECITNIHKHSSNPEVDIKIIEHPSMYQIVIYDYDPDSKAASGSSEISGRQSGADSEKPDIYSDGIGLANIRSRVDSLGGKLSITTDDGFKVFVTIPIN
jgi:signal transduction histidine kinase